MGTITFGLLVLKYKKVFLIGGYGNNTGRGWKEFLSRFSRELAKRMQLLISNILSYSKLKGIPFLLQQLIVNLVRNALKFSKSGTAPHITITASGEPASLPDESQSPDKFYAIIVRDNGIGLGNRLKSPFSKCSPGCIIIIANIVAQVWAKHSAEKS